MIADYVRIGLSSFCVLVGLCFFVEGCSVASDEDGSLSTVRYELQSPSFRELRDATQPQRIAAEDAIRQYPTLSVIEVISGKVTMAVGVLWFILAALIVPRFGRCSFSWVAFDPPAGP